MVAAMFRSLPLHNYPKTIKVFVKYLFE